MYQVEDEKRNEMLRVIAEMPLKYGMHLWNLVQEMKMETKDKIEKLEAANELEKLKQEK